MIYFVLCNQYVKIGTTDNMTNRIQSLQSSSPYKLEVLKIMDAPDEYEKQLHKEFAHLHIRGEWFLYEQPIQNFIKSIPIKNVKDKFITISQAAEELGVSINTLRQWDKDNLLVPNKTPFGHRRYSLEKLKEFNENNNKR